jgi:hypothetical protein
MEIWEMNMWPGTEFTMDLMETEFVDMDQFDKTQNRPQYQLSSVRFL